MNHLSIPTTVKAKPLIASEPSSPTKQAGVTWKKRIGLFMVTMIVLALLTPVMLAWAGNVWINEDKLTSVLHPANVRLDEMPDYVWQSFVSIEDHRFLKHHGVDPIALVRAVWIDVQAGEYVQGGSTITMQLARNLFLTHDKTMLRKGKEMAIALQLELRYSKKELLEMYLNVIYFGHGRYGIDGASELYFGKAASGSGTQAITLGESAILAALPKAPEAYSPLKHWEKAKQRQHVVLQRMAELGIISQSEQKQAEEEIVPVVRSVKPAS